MRGITEIIIHSSDSPNGRDDRAEDIHRWHKQKLFSGIGYHYVICVDGKEEVGRPEYWVGAHAFGHNKNSIGVCLIGRDKYSDEQWSTLFVRISDLMFRYPKAKVIGHNEISSKSCPGFDVQEWLNADENFKRWKPHANY